MFLVNELNLIPIEPVYHATIPVLTVVTFPVPEHAVILKASFDVSEARMTFDGTTPTATLGFYYDNYPFEVGDHGYTFEVLVHESMTVRLLGARPTGTLRYTLQFFRSVVR